MPRVVITLPAYRAEQTLAKTVADIPAGSADLMILVDDHSKDNTAALARQLGMRVIVHPVQRGYGGNQKTCYTQALAAGADIVVLLHPDYQYDPKAVPLLMAPILAGDADMTFGSRFAGLGDPLRGGMPRYRYVGNRVTTFALNLMLGSRFTELHSGMRAYTRRCLLSLPFLGYTDDFAFDSQFLIDAITSGVRVVEVPIPTRYTKESSSISVGRSVRYVSESLAYGARRTAARGRRGSRWPVAKRMERPRMLARGRPVELRCTLCGRTEHSVVYAANSAAPPTPEDFACTTPGLGQHDDIVQCSSCGLISAVSPVAPKDLLEIYKAVKDLEYLTEEQAKRESFARVLARLAAFPVRGRRLLEIGSHVGLFLDAAGQHGWDARGIEPSTWAVEEGRRRFGVDLRHGALEELHEPDSSADAIVLLDVLEHLADPPAALRSIRPLIDEEGILAVSTVNLSGLHAMVRDGAWSWFMRSHRYYFSPETLQQTLARAGFRMVHWSLVPRSFRLSYLSKRAGKGSIGRSASLLAKYVDPRIPVGWLGDVALALARPA
jgi:2-polyprenyl-3-methyl-5-hydroxy-6-metoxy-1,4-benzoquinol methylase